MKKVSVFLIVCLMFTACHTPRQVVLQRDTVTITRIDTFIRAFPLYVADTVTIPAALDSLTFNWPGASTTVIYQLDTLFRWRVKTQVKNDTIYLTRTDTVFKEVTAAPTLPAAPAGGGFPWGALMAFLGVLLVWWGGKQRENKK